MGRVKTAVAKANKRLPIQLAAMLLAGSTLLSALLGVLRERFLNRLYYDD